MKPTKHYLKALLVIIISLSILLSGCAKKVHETSQMEAIDEPLLVFVLDTNSRQIIKHFQTAYSDIEMKVVEVSRERAKKTNEKVISWGDAMEYFIELEGTPDLILGSVQDVNYWMENGYIQEFGDLFGADETFEEDAYYPGVSEIGRIEGAMYGLPLGLEANYWTLREEAWQNSTFRRLEKNYTVKELLDCLEEQLEEEVQLGAEGRFVIDQGFSNMANTYEALWQFGAIQVKEEGITLDQDLFEQICRVQGLLTENGMSQSLFFTESVDMPLDGNGDYIISNWSGSNHAWNGPCAPQIGLIHAQSLNHQVFAQETRVLWLPYKTDNGNSEYAAKVSCWGMIGSQTTRTQEVYEVIRLMMDMMPAAYYENYHTIAYIPVHRQNALDMIDCTSDLGITMFMYQTEEGHETLQKEELDPELRKSLEEFLNNITLIYTEQSFIQSSVWNIVYDRYTMNHGNGTNDYSECYDEVLTILQESHSGEN